MKNLNKDTEYSIIAYINSTHTINEITNPTPFPASGARTMFKFRTLANDNDGM